MVERGEIRRQRPLHLPWGKNFEHIDTYLKRLRVKYGGRLPYPEELRKSSHPKERAFFNALTKNRLAGVSPSLDLLPTYGETQANDAEAEYTQHHATETRGKLALLEPRLHRRLWRHRKKGSLEIVPVLEKISQPWGSDPWGYYVKECRGMTRGKVKMASDAHYQALRRQILPAGTVLPDGSKMQKADFAINQIPTKKTRQS